MYRSSTLGGSVLVVGTSEAIRGAFQSAPFVWCEMCFQESERGRVGYGIQSDL